MNPFRFIRRTLFHVAFGIALTLMAIPFILDKQHWSVRYGDWLKSKFESGCD